MQFHALYGETTKKPIKKVGDAGWDCFVHHFVQYFPQSDLRPEEIKHFINGNTPTETEWMLPSLVHEYNYTNPNGNPYIVGCALGFATAIPQGYFAQITPRSGLALKHGIECVIGTIDPSYRGEWVAIMKNHSKHDYTIHVGDKICQFVIRPYIDVTLDDTPQLSNTERGNGGFGHSGK